MVKVDYETMMTNLEDNLYGDFYYVDLPLYPENYVFNDKYSDVWNKRQLDALNEEITELNNKRSGIKNLGELLFYKDLAEFVANSNPFFTKAHVQAIIEYTKNCYATTFEDAFHIANNFMETHKLLNVLDELE